ncbi:MAG: hypothetical protein Q8K60_08545 [Parachlamydiaceae bacterium]|nr:hypothetical protein [Parachlamydiaceae bacterium]
MNIHEDNLSLNQPKQLIEWALSVGRTFQSKQTGFIHYHHGDVGNEGHQTIPFYENVLFALALFKSRLIDQIQEGKELLNRLLGFQNKDGLFPAYLHEYPKCLDIAQGLQALCPFYWILKKFGHILGIDLKTALEKSAYALLKACFDQYNEKNLSYYLAVRLSASQVAFGILLKDEKLKSDGERNLNSLAEHQLTDWYYTGQLGEMLVGLRMVYPSLKNTPWEPLWNHVVNTWHGDIGCYIGPNIREWYDKSEPKPSLYDLILANDTEFFPERLKTPQIYHLKGVLIDSIHSIDQLDEKESNVVRGSFQDQKWEIHRFKDFSYNLLEKNHPPKPTTDKTFTPFMFIWKGKQVNSFICQGGCYEKAFYQVQDQVIQLNFDLTPISPISEGDKRPEIEFFMNFQPDFQIQSNGLPSNTFELNQPIQMKLGKHQVILKFELIEGDGDFMLHFIRGNRPSETHLKGSDRFNSYDWTLFLRTIRRQGPCKIRATIQF